MLEKRGGLKRGTLTGDCGAVSVMGCLDKVELMASAGTGDVALEDTQAQWGDDTWTLGGEAEGCHIPGTER